VPGTVNLWANRPADVAEENGSAPTGTTTSLAAGRAAIERHGVAEQAWLRHSTTWPALMVTVCGLKPREVVMSTTVVDAGGRS
jgi:hypothetical protein